MTPSSQRCRKCDHEYAQHDDGYCQTCFGEAFLLGTEVHEACFAPPEDEDDE